MDHADPRSPLPFDQFAVLLLSDLGLELPDSLSSDIDLYTDLGVDSMQAFQLVIRLEELASSATPDEDLPDIYTLGDAYEFYRSLEASQR